MAAGATIKSKRKSGAFSGGDLATGELGFDTSGKHLFSSTTGSDIVRLTDLVPTAVKTASYTVAAGELARFDLSAASAHFNITLPASPADGDMVGYLIVDDHASYDLGVIENGNNVDDAAAGGDYLRGLTAGDCVVLRFTTGEGWHTVHDAIQPAFAACLTTATAPGTGAWYGVPLQSPAHSRGVDYSSNRINIRRRGNYAFGWDGSQYTTVGAAHYWYAGLWKNGAALVSGGPNYILANTLMNGGCHWIDELDDGDYVQPAQYAQSYNVGTAADHPFYVKEVR